MIYPKKKPILNPHLIARLRDLPCIVCRGTPVHVHHIKTRGSGGDDVEENLAPLCPKHHNEVHKVGVESFVKKYPLLRATNKRWD